MKKIILVLVSIVISITTLLYTYYSIKINKITDEVYINQSNQLKKEIETQIRKKQGDTSALTYVISSNQEVKEALLQNDNSKLDFNNILSGLAKRGEFKDLWIQVIDNKGYSFYRSWTNKVGDNISKARADIGKMIKKPKPMNQISTGKFDMTFKSIIPIYSGKKFIGMIEMISHFNSVASNLKKKSIEPLMIVDKSYTPKFIKPLSGLFIGENYVVNKNASLELMKKIEKHGINKFLAIQNYMIFEDYIVTVYQTKNLNNKPMGYHLLFYKLNNIDIEKIKSYQVDMLMIFIVIISFILLTTILIINKRYLKQLNDEVSKKTVDLENQKELLNSIVGSYDKHVIFSRTNLKGIITHASEAFCDISGYTQDELIGQPHNIVRHLDMPSSIFKDVWKKIKSGQTWKGEVKNIKKDGGYYWVMSDITPEYDKEGNIQGYISVRHDITAKKDFEKQHEQLLQSEKLASMGEMIGNIAHQWRQPLSIISTGATGMQIQKEYGHLTDEYFKNTCEMIDQNAQYLSKTIDDFKNFIKGDSVKREFLLKDEVQTLLQLVDGLIKTHHIDVVLDLEEDLRVYGLKNELTQCLINIFNNAKDALVLNNKKEKLIFIRTLKEDNKVVIIIKDNAGGIPNDILPKIFEPYFTTKHTDQGTGLGLHMTYNLLIDGMGGTIEAKNTNYEYENEKYEGALFTIKLPID